MAEGVPPLFTGRRAVSPHRRVEVRDPRGVSIIRGTGVLFAAEYVAGDIQLLHVDLGHNRIVHVPPAWIVELPAAPNVVALARPPLTLEELLRPDPKIPREDPKR